MSVEVLVSTMNQKDYSLIKRMRIATDAVIVNQCDKNDVKEFYQDGNRIKWINSATRGLSVSRNICLAEASADICLIADDDLEYVDNYEEIVKNAFDAHEYASVIRFQAEGIEKKLKDYSDKAGNIGFFKSMKMSSYEMAVRRDKVKGIFFDELIGAGTQFCMGEENAFLVHCIKKGLKIHYIPECISHIHMLSSSWRNISDERYLISRGAAFAAMETRFTDLLILQFAVRKRHLFDKSLTLFRRIKLMKAGKRKYRTAVGGGTNVKKSITG